MSTEKKEPPANWYVTSRTSKAREVNGRTVCEVRASLLCSGVKVHELRGPTAVEILTAYAEKCNALKKTAPPAPIKTAMEGWNFPAT